MRLLRSPWFVVPMTTALSVCLSLLYPLVKLHGRWWPGALLGVSVLIVAVLAVGTAAEQAPEDAQEQPATRGQAVAEGVPRMVTNSLRSLPHDFTGRDAELETIAEAVAELVAAGRGVRVVSLWGMPGMGKTLLAERAADLHRDAFADRTLYVPLHAHSGTHNQREAREVLGSLLADDDDTSVPDELDERAGRWRDRMAGKRMLLVLDDAAGADQIRPLLPGADSMCLVLVTSRDQLVDLHHHVHTRLLEVGGLAEDEAVALLAGRAGRTFTAEDEQAARRLVRRCGFHPQAISILACALRANVASDVARLYDALEHARREVSQDAPGLLDLIDRQVHDKTLTLYAAFHASYTKLPPDARRVFRLMGCHPGTHLDADAVSAVLPRLRDSAGMLELLRGRGLCGHVTTAAGVRTDRYEVHDLIRDFAGKLASRRPEWCAEARQTLLRHYRRVAMEQARSAEPLLTRHTRPAAWRHGSAVALERRAEAVAWFELERGNLLGLFGYAEQHGLDEQVVELVDALAGFLRNSGPWDAAVRLHESAVAAAARRGEPLAHGVALNDLGIIRRLTHDLTGANHALRAAYQLFWGRLADGHDPDVCLLGAANALHERGIVANLMGRRRWAIAALGRALGLYWWIGDDIGIANAAKNLGLVHFQNRDWDMAADLLAAALAGYQRLGDVLGEAEVHNRRGQLWLDSGRPGTALADFEAALSRARRTSSGLEQARAQEGIGRASLALGDPVAARRHGELAQRGYQDMGADHDAAMISGWLADLPATAAARPEPGWRARWSRSALAVRTRR
jgi:tetratricopeptide (TPR) repeat protein